MNILIINHYAIPPTEMGGTRHFDLAKALIELGHRVSIIAADFNHFQLQHPIKPLPQENFSQQTIDGVDFIRLHTPAYKNNSIKRLFNMFAFAKQLIKHRKQLITITQPDIIIGSSPHLFAAIAAKLIASSAHAPFVFEVRDLWPETLVALNKLSRKHPLCWLMQKIETYLYKNADHILTLLPNAHEYINKHGGARTPISWLPNATHACIADLPSIKNINPSITTFMYAGSHGLANCLTTVLEAAEICQQQGWGDSLRIILIGDGPEKTALQQQAKAKQLICVEFQDAVPKQQIYQKLAQADAYLMLLKDSPVFAWGISPNKLFDYMIMAKPLIFAVNSPNNPVAENSAGFSIEPENPKQLARAMQQVANLSIQEREAMGERARNYVLNNHSVPVISKKLESILLQTVSKKIEVDKSVQTDI